MPVQVILSLLISLGLTLIIEAAFAYAAGIRQKKDLLLVCMVNIITNPAVVLCYYLIKIYTQWSIVPAIILLEIAAFIIEAMYYRRYALTIRHPFRFSAFANALSYGFGFLLNHI